MGQFSPEPAQTAPDEYQTCEAESVLTLERSVARQEVFGKLIWRPERAAEVIFAIAWVTLSIVGCASDYVYIQNNRSEGQVRQDYAVCAEQQFKVSNNTTQCMERKGYRTVKIDATSPAPLPADSAPSVQGFLP